MGYVKIDGYEIDAALKEEHAREAIVTEYPIEEGSDVTDHVLPKPKRYSLDGVVSDTPMGGMREIRANQGAFVEGETTFGVKPSDDALAKLEEIFENRKAVTIETELKTYENMFMESLSVPRDKETGEALRFSAKFKQGKFIKNERTTVRVAVPRAAKKVNRGNKPAKPKEWKNTTRVAKYKDSWLGQISQGLGALEGQGSGTEDVVDAP